MKKIIIVFSVLLAFVFGVNMQAQDGNDYFAGPAA